MTTPKLPPELQFTAEDLEAILSFRFGKQPDGISNTVADLLNALLAERLEKRELKCQDCGGMIYCHEWCWMEGIGLGM